VPIFYRDTLSFGAVFLAPTQGLKALLPSARMFPLRIAPRRGALSINVMEFRDTDLGPYNEVSISVPFTLDKATPVFTGIVRKPPAEPWLFIRHLPVTTEIALAAGVEFAGYPKFIADIEFEQGAEHVTCRLAEEGRHILTLAGRKLELRNAPRSRWHPFTVRNGRLLRSEVICSERQMAVSKAASSVRLELGDHPIAEELRGLSLGRMLSYQYAPQFQTVLTPVIESYPL
jgi:hypothetical protein